MRPIRLKMTAFGAYVKPIEIDFEAGLGGENFFLIHGATGSGKTTILDAICFALYGESSGGNRKSSMMRSEQATPNDKTEVEFVFSLRGKIYRIVRSPKYERAKQRGSGTTEEKAFAEIYVNGERISTRDVTEYVRGILKFDSEQFRQVVVLPQGAFQTFLMAKSDTRQKVLNMLFNAEFFKRVEDELKIRAHDAENVFKTLSERKETQLDDAKEVSGEENVEKMMPMLIKRFADELAAAQAQILTLTGKSLDAQKKFNDGEKISALFKDLDKKSQELSDAQQLLQKISAELAAAKIEFDRRTAEESLRKKLERQASALKKLLEKRSDLEKAIAAAKKSESTVESLVKLKKSCDDTMSRLKSEVEALQDAPAKLKVAEQELKCAQDREKLLAEIAKLRREIDAAKKKFDTAVKNYDASEKKLAELRELQISGSAARLAANLEDGKPCPVCGAIHHPKPATSADLIPTDAQIKSAEAKFKSLSDEKTAAAENLNKLTTTIKLKEKTLSEIAQVKTVAEGAA